MAKKIEKKEVDPILEADEVKEATPSTEAPKVEKPKEVKKLNDVDIVAQTKAILDAQEHTNFIIPMADGEQEGAYDTIQINGYKLTIKKGVMVNIPIAVANLLAEKYRINMTAGMNKRIDRDNEHSEALG
jgi:hypothetical protein